MQMATRQWLSVYVTFTFPGNWRENYDESVWVSLSKKYVSTKTIRIYKAKAKQKTGKLPQVTV